MRIVQKETVTVQRNDISLAYLESFYMQPENKEKLILIYNGIKYWTVLDYNLLRSVHTQRELEVFLYIDCCQEYILDENDQELAEEIYRHAKTSIIPIMSESGIRKFIQMVLPVEEHIYINSIHKLESYLKEIGASAYHIRIPLKDELTRNIHDFVYFAGDSLMWRECNRNYVDSMLRYVTDKGYTEAKSAALAVSSLEGKILGNGNRKIFLVGSCIANGWTGLKGDELATILNEMLGGQYEIQCVLMGRFDNVKKYQLLEHDIRNNDLIILLDYGLDLCDTAIDVAALFSEYKGDKWLYYDIPVHTTRYGNELLAKAIAEKIVFSHNWDKNGDKSRVIHKGMPMLCWHDEEIIKKYCDKLPKKQGCGRIGAVVMNCNPFTLGHRYLVEQALLQTDVLYLFVVEEDASEFSFEERFGMVKAGVADLKNVTVVPSGRFILSRESFRNYFEKEQLQGVTVDASKDLHIFAEYIAKELDIKKRFVGEEPFDTVTRQYNQQMKEILEKAGIEVVEIPRKLVRGMAISASRVRKYLKTGDWQTVQELVPQATMAYLQKHVKAVEKNEKVLDRYEQKVLRNMIDFIHNFDRTVLYGTGRDALGLLKYMPEEVIEKLDYCDRRAYTEDYRFMGKKVIAPSELSATDNGNGILISSTGYRYEIYDMLEDLGISKECIMFNPICFGN